MKRISFYIVIVLLGVSFFTSCEEQGLLTHTNDVSYIAFEKNMTKIQQVYLLSFTMKVKMLRYY